MDLFDTLTFAEILGRTTFLGTLSLTALMMNFHVFLFLHVPNELSLNFVDCFAEPSSLESLGVP
jgi:hypothetical protein